MGSGDDRRVILALDQGTTSSRAIAFGPDGSVRGVAQQEIGLSFPQPGWVEQDPRGDLGGAARHRASRRWRAAGVQAADVAAVGITNQRETTIIWDRADRRCPSRRPSCGRTGARRSAARSCGAAGHEDLVRGTTGLVLDPYFSATKIAGCWTRCPGARARAERGELAFGTVDTWLAWQPQRRPPARHRRDQRVAHPAVRPARRRLGRRAARAASASRAALLPEVRDTSGVVGETDAGVLGAPVPLAGMVGDQQAALFGQACTTRGMTKVTYGTGCFLLMHTGDEPVASPGGLLSTVAAQIGGHRTYALEGSVFIGGAAVQWLRDGLGIIEDAAEVGRAGRHGAGQRRRVLRAGARRPGRALVGAARARRHPGPHARLHGRPHRARHAGGHRLPGRRPAGRRGGRDAGVTPRRASAWTAARRATTCCMQFQADVLGVPVVRAAQTESTALGAALLAGLAAGVWSGQDEAAAIWSAARTFTPGRTSTATPC